MKIVNFAEFLHNTLLLHVVLHNCLFQGHLFALEDFLPSIYKQSF